MSFALPLLPTVLVFALIVTVRYFLASSFFALLGELRRRGFHAGRGRQIAREIGWSVASAVVYALPAGVVAWGWQARGWTLIYLDPHAWPLWWMPASVLVLLALHDSWFYWTHRWMHRPRVFRLIHAVHHSSRPPTAWAAMSFHPLEAATGAVFLPLAVVLVPVHAGALLVVLMVMTVMGVTNHMGWELFPKWLVGGRLGRWLITASHHERHHRSYLCNYGLYFRVWDRLCGTDRGLCSFERAARVGQVDRAGSRTQGARMRRPAPDCHPEECK